MASSAAEFLVQERRNKKTTFGLNALALTWRPKNKTRLLCSTGICNPHSVKLFLFPTSTNMASSLHALSLLIIPSIQQQPQLLLNHQILRHFHRRRTPRLHSLLARSHYGGIEQSPSPP
ncbi:hypothetical protein N665_0260s0007 [Sinapis alba]|nr:hypothetical protein N665_0260s0007 [Sinapis alba]